MSLLGSKHAWKGYGIQLGGIQFVTLQSLEKDPSRSLEFVYGTGEEPQDLVSGDRQYSGTVTIEKQELVILLDAFAANTALDLPPLPIIEKSENAQGQLVTYTYVNAQFESEGHAINRNDPQSPIKLPFKALGMIRG